MKIIPIVLISLAPFLASAQELSAVKKQALSEVEGLERTNKTK